MKPSEIKTYKNNSGDKNFYTKLAIKFVLGLLAILILTLLFECSLSYRIEDISSIKIIATKSPSSDELSIMDGFQTINDFKTFENLMYVDFPEESGLSLDFIHALIKYAVFYMFTLFSVILFPVGTYFFSVEIAIRLLTVLYGLLCATLLSYIIDNIVSEIAILIVIISTFIDSKKKRRSK